MNLKEFFSDLTEGMSDSLARNKLQKAGKPDLFEPLFKLDNTQTKKHLPKLADFAIEGIPLETIKYYYEKFLHSRLAPVDIYKFKTFQQFEQAVDSVPIKISQAESITLPPVYSDNNVIIYRANNKIEAIILGRGYSWCISNPTPGGNMYYSYRFTRGSTFYFCRFKNRPMTDYGHYAIIDVRQRYSESEPTYQITLSDNGAHGGGTTDTTPDEIMKKFPELGPVFVAKIFQPNPLGEHEEESYNNIMSTSTISQLKKYEDKVMYINLGKFVNDNDWGNLELDLKRLYINVGVQDISDHQKNTIAGTGLATRYEEMLNIRLQQKLGRDVGLTQDEQDFIYENPNKVTIPENKQDARRILKGLVAEGNRIETYRLLSEPKKSLYVYFIFYRLPGDETDLAGLGASTLYSEILGSPQEIIMKKGIAHKLKVGEPNYGSAEHGYILSNLNYYLPIIQANANKEELQSFLMEMIFNHARNEKQTEKFIDTYFGKDFAAKLFYNNMVQRNFYQSMGSIGPINYEWPPEDQVAFVNYLGGGKLIKSLLQRAGMDSNFGYSLARYLMEKNQLHVIRDWGLIDYYRKLHRVYPTQDHYSGLPKLPVDPKEYGPATSLKANTAYLLSQTKYVESQLYDALGYTKETPYAIKSRNWLASSYGHEHSLKFLVSLMSKIALLEAGADFFNRYFYKHIIQILHGTGQLARKELERYIYSYGESLLKEHIYEPGFLLLANVIPLKEIPDELKLFFFRLYIKNENIDKLPDLVKSTKNDKKMLHYMLFDITYGYGSNYGYSYSGQLLITFKPGDPILAAFPSDVIREIMVGSSGKETQFRNPYIHVNYRYYANPLYYEMKRRGEVTDPTNEIEAAQHLRGSENYNDYKDVMYPPITKRDESKEKMLADLETQREKEMKEGYLFRKNDDSGFFRLRRPGPIISPSWSSTVGKS
jgi:hypothetical protein